MTTELRTIEIQTCQHWRAWLEKHHASSQGIWLLFHKNHTDTKSLSYDDSVREALCFGWVDSLIKRLDENCYARKFTPRHPTSKWSDTNRSRWAELKAAGLLTAAGLAAAPTDNSYEPRPTIPDLPAYLAEALQANANAWSFFQTLAPSHRRNFVRWVHSAKRPETRAKRIQESIALLKAGQKLGLK